MKGSCNLELRLVSTPSFSVPKSSMETPTENQQLTIFYNGTVAACDVTELQARAIILLANRENEEKKQLNWVGSDPFSPLLNSSLSLPATAAGLSMKRSLQRFLQKRKARAQGIASVPVVTKRSKI